MTKSRQNNLRNAVSFFGKTTSSVFLRVAAIALCAATAFVMPVASDAFGSVDSRNENAKPVFEPGDILRPMRARPLIFEENIGQTDESVLFLARFDGGTLFFTAREAIMAFDGAGAASRGPDARAVGVEDAGNEPASVVRMTFENANADSRPVGSEPLDATVNYFVGSDESAWKTDVPTYGEIARRQIYPGIDVVFHGKGGRLEFDFVVGPGADPKAIRMSFDGIEAMDRGEDGALVLTAAGSGRRIAFDIPSIYQLKDGEKTNIEGDFAISASEAGKDAGKRSVGFRLGEYDKSAALVIDPQLAYSTYLGGNSWSDHAYAIAVDDDGNIYVTGYTHSSNWPASSAYQPGPAGSSDVFVTKFKSDGSQLLFSTYLGGGSSEIAQGLALDDENNVVVCGWTFSGNFPTTEGAFDRNHYGDEWTDIFVAKLHAAGNQLIFSTYIGGDQNDFARDLALDSNGNVYVVGDSFGDDFPTVSAFQANRKDAHDAVVLKLSANGSSLVFSTYLGGYNEETGRSIAVDGAGYCYVTGRTSSWDDPGTEDIDESFPATPDAYRGPPDPLNPAEAGTYAFMTRFSASGAMSYSSYFALGDGRAIALDGSGNVYITGETQSEAFPATPGAFQKTFNGFIDCFLAKFSSGFSSLRYATYIGGSYWDEPWDVEVDENGYAYVTGLTKSSDFPAANAFQSYSGADSDCFVLSMNASGRNLRYSTFLGGNGLDIGYALALGDDENAYVAGWTKSSNFPTVDAYQDYLYAGGDMFLARIGKPESVPAASETTEEAKTSTDPVQLATGEYFMTLAPDLDLGGPMPVRLARYYASRLYARSAAASALGPNWLHNFDLRLLDAGEDVVSILYFKGQVVHFDKVEDEWVPRSPQKTKFQLAIDACGDHWLMDPKANLVVLFDGDTGKPLFFTDRNSNRIDFAYNQDGLLETASDGLGRTLTFGYTDGNLTSVTDGTRTVSYSYTDGVLTGYADAMTFAYTYEYDLDKPLSGPLLVRAVKPEGNCRMRQIYDDAGRVVQQTDPYDNSYTFQYDTPEEGWTRTVDPLGDSQDSLHENDRYWTAWMNEDGETASAAYDADGRRTAATDRTGETSSFSYHEETGLLMARTNAKDRTTERTYSESHQTFENAQTGGTATFIFYLATRVDHPDGTHNAMAYDQYGNMTSFTDRQGETTSMEYDGMGLVTSIENPLGGRIDYAYNSDGTKKSGTSSTYGKVDYAYDALKRFVRRTYSDGKTFEIVYDDNDRVASVTDENGNQTEYAYDDNGNLVEIEDALGQTKTLVRDNMDRTTRIVDFRGNSTNIGYDELDRYSSVEDPAGVAGGYTYTTDDRVESTSVGGKAVLTYGYDPEGVMSSITTATGSRTDLETDELGNLAAVVGPGGERTEFKYDSMNRLVSVTDPKGVQSTFSYTDWDSYATAGKSGLGEVSFERNAMGMVTAIVDTSSNRWSFSYNSAGDMISRRDPLDNEWTHAYGGRGRVDSVAFDTGVAVDFTYDGVGNLLSKSYDTGLAINYEYDALNRITRAWRDSVFDYSSEYDAMGNATSTTLNGVEFDATYDAANRMETMTYCDGAFVVTYTYHANTGLLSGVSDNLTGTSISFAYDDDLRRTSIERSSDVDTQISWEAPSRISKIQHGALGSVAYEYDAAGRVVGISSALPLDPGEGAGSESVSYEYDAACQIVTAQSPGDTAYDERGRMTASAGRAFTWDADSRLTQIDGVSMAYDGYGNAIGRTESGATSLFYHGFALGGAPMVAEKNQSSGAWLRYYVHTPDGRLLYMIDAQDGNAVYFYHFDLIGNTLFLTNSAGAVTDAYAYTPYGRLVARTGSNPQPFTFVGERGVRQEGQAGDLYQMRNRYYDAASHRFLSRDPRWLDTADIEFVIPYLYASNPLLGTDPSGNELIFDVATFTDKHSKENESSTAKTVSYAYFNLIPGSVEIEAAFDAVLEGENTEDSLSKIGGGAFRDVAASEWTAIRVGLQILDDYLWIWEDNIRTSPEKMKAGGEMGTYVKIGNEILLAGIEFAKGWTKRNTESIKVIEDGLTRIGEWGAEIVQGKFKKEYLREFPSYKAAERCADSYYALSEGNGEDNAKAVKKNSESKNLIVRTNHALGMLIGGWLYP